MLNHRIVATRDTKFYKWLQQLGADNEDDAEEEPLDEEEDAVGNCIEEFDCLDISGGIDDIVDKDLFDKEVVDEGNIFNWGNLWLLYNTIWYYTILYGTIPHSLRRFQLYKTIGKHHMNNENI